MSKWFLAATMFLNYKEEFSPKRCVPTFKGLGKRMMQPFNPLMTFVILFLYLLAEGIMFLDASLNKDEHKICYIGHIFGLVSGIVVGIIILDNKVKENWEKILKRVLIFIYTITFLTLLIVNFSFVTENEEKGTKGENHGLPNPCWDCWKSFWNESATHKNHLCYMKYRLISDW